MSEYAERDIIEQGEHYAKHVNAMTAEALHSKSDIAAELACRDIQIKQLKQRELELMARVARLERAFNQMDKALISMGSGGTLMPTVNYQEMLRAVSEEKHQSLAEHDADTLTRFKDALLMWLNSEHGAPPGFYDGVKAAADQAGRHASQLRQQAGKG